MASKTIAKTTTTRKTPAKKATAPTTVAKRTKYFTASWCGPCQLMHRMLGKHPDLAARLEVIDIDEHEALADRYEVEAVPTFVRPDGKRESGAMNAKALRAFLDD